MIPLDRQVRVDAVALEVDGGLQDEAEVCVDETVAVKGSYRLGASAQGGSRSRAGRQREVQQVVTADLRPPLGRRDRRLVHRQLGRRLLGAASAAWLPVIFWCVHVLQELSKVCFCRTASSPATELQDIRWNSIKDLISNYNGSIIV